MATIKKFEEIEAWKKSRVLANQIFDLSLNTELKKDFALRDQINRSTGSIMDNIAEGFERGSKKEFMHFLYISKGSAGEVRAQLYRLLDRGYIDNEKFQDLKNQIQEISKTLAGLIKYLKETELQGYKFKEDIHPYNPYFEH